MKSAALAAVLATFAVTARAEEERCIPFSTEAELAGRVFNFTYFGPPTYGEKPERDFKATYLAVVMDTPICFQGGKLKTAHNQTILQLMLPPAALKPGLLGGMVSVRGKVVRGGNARRHFTELVMQPAEIQPLGR